MEAGVGARGIEDGFKFEKNQYIRALLIGPFQPLQSTIVLAQAGINPGRIDGGNMVTLRELS